MRSKITPHSNYIYRTRFNWQWVIIALLMLFLIVGAYIKGADSNTTGLMTECARLSKENKDLTTKNARLLENIEILKGKKASLSYINFDTMQNLTLNTPEEDTDNAE